MTFLSYTLVVSRPRARKDPFAFGISETGLGTAEDGRAISCLSSKGRSSITHPFTSPVRDDRAGLNPFTPFAYALPSLILEFGFSWDAYA